MTSNSSSFSSSSSSFLSNQKLFGWLAMFLAIMSGSSIGPMFKYMENNGILPLMAASWRCQCMLFFLIPLAIIEIYLNPQKRTNYMEIKDDLKYPIIIYILIAGLSWAGNLLSWIQGLKYVSVVKASIIASLHPLLLVFVLAFTGEKISLLEWLGTIVSICGMLISSAQGLYHLYHSENTSNEAVNARLELYGLSLCFIAAASEVVVILNRVKIKKYVPLMQYTASTTFVIAILASFFSIVTVEDGFSHILCLDETCLFGWASHKWLGTILIFAFIVGVICVMGFNYAISYISPLVFSSIQLVDPIMTGIIAWIAGIEGIPDLYTWIGGFVVLSGVGLITYGEFLRTHGDNTNHETNEENIISNKEGKSIELTSDGSIDETETVLLYDDDNLSLITDDSHDSKSLINDIERGQDSNNNDNDEEIVLNTSSYLQLNKLWNKDTSHEYSVLSSVEEDK